MAKGSEIVVRIDKKNHAEMKILAIRKGCSLFELMNQACEEYMKRQDKIMASKKKGKKMI